MVGTFSSWSPRPDPLLFGGIWTDTSEEVVGKEVAARLMTKVADGYKTSVLTASAVANSSPRPDIREILPSSLETAVGCENISTQVAAWPW